MTASAAATWDLPMLGGPSRVAMHRARMKPGIAGSRTGRGSRSDWRAKSNSLKALWCNRPESVSALRNRLPSRTGDVLLEDLVKVAESGGLGPGGPYGGFLG